MSDTETEAEFDLGAELTASLGDFLTEAEEAAGEDDTVGDIIARAEVNQARAKKLAEAEYTLAKLAQEQAAVEIREARSNAAQAKVDKKLAALQQKRADLIEMRDEALEATSGPLPGHVDDDGSAQGAVGKRFEQIITELDMRIEEVEAVGPFVGMDDAALGTFTLLPHLDPRSGADTGRSYYTDTSGEFGTAARELEDAEHNYNKVLQERNGDETSLRVQDAKAELNKTRARVDSLRAEIDRRNAAKLLAQHQAENAHELALERATAADAKRRKELEADTSLSAEDKAVELARLQVGMDQRSGKDKEKWKELLAQAAEEVREAGRKFQVENRMHAGFFPKDDPLMRFLKNGDRMDIETAERYGTTNEAEAEALARLGAVDGKPGRVKPGWYKVGPDHEVEVIENAYRGPRTLT